MNRRSFLRRLGLGIAGFALSRQLSGILPAPPLLALPTARDAVTGISIRFVRNFDATTSRYINRLDVFMPDGTISGVEMAARIHG